MYGFGGYLTPVKNVNVECLVYAWRGRVCMFQALNVPHSSSSQLIVDRVRKEQLAVIRRAFYSLAVQDLEPMLAIQYRETDEADDCTKDEDDTGNVKSNSNVSTSWEENDKDHCSTSSNTGKSSSTQLFQLLDEQGFPCSTHLVNGVLYFKRVPTAVSQGGT